MFVPLQLAWLETTELALTFSMGATANSSPTLWRDVSRNIWLRAVTSHWINSRLEDKV